MRIVDNSPHSILSWIWFIGLNSRSFGFVRWLFEWNLTTVEQRQVENKTAKSAITSQMRVEYGCFGQNCCYWAIVLHANHYRQMVTHAPYIFVYPCSVTCTPSIPFNHYLLFVLFFLVFHFFFVFGRNRRFHELDNFDMYFSPLGISTCKCKYTSFPVWRIHIYYTFSI